MGIVLTRQLAEFLYSVALGAVLGVYYDILAVFKSYIKGKKWLTLLFDVLFWLGAIVALFAFVILCTKGNMRWYVLLGNFFGIFLYKNTISALFFCGIRIIISLVVKVLHIIVQPLYIISRWLYRKGSEIFGKEEKETPGLRKEQEKESEKEYVVP